MRLLTAIKDHRNERRLFVGRVVFATVIACLLLAVVIARLIQLQILEHEQFAERSQGNRIQIEPVPPIRGLIFDRSGQVLAENIPAYQLELVPEQIDDIDATLHRLASLGLIESDDIAHFEELSRSGPRFKPVTLRFSLSEQEIATFALQRARMPGVDFQPRLIRHYPHGPDVAHAIGYVGALSTSDLQRLDPSRYAGTSHTGKTGVESSYEDELHGEPGFRHVLTNARGRQLPADSLDLLGSLPADESPTPGDNVYVSLDLKLQQVAMKEMGDQRGAVVAIDPWSGEILAMVSTPSFDPNAFVVGMTTAQFSALQNDPDNPLFNRAVRGTYPPGSTIKPMLALAALATGATNLTRKIFCRGYYTLPNSTHRYRDWKPAGHGEVDLHDALEQSCDVYFYEISQALGIDRMHDYLDEFGLGHPTGVDIGGEKSGLVPSKEWKRQTFSNPADQRWYNGETVIASVGQGYMLVTPLQLAEACATLATRGIRYQPHLVIATENRVTGKRSEVAPKRLDDVDIKNEFYWQNVIEGMHDVMQGSRGTARAVGRGASYQMAGKSGTAQVFSVGQDETYNKEDVAERLRDHALFIAFAPLENPQIAVAVVVENGSGGSSVAAPIAKAIMDNYIKPDPRHAAKR